MHVDELMVQLGSELNLAEVSLNEQNTCRLIINECITVDLEWSPHEDLLHVYSSLGNGPGVTDDDGMHWAEIMLHANAFGHDTGRASLALHEGNVLLSRHFDLASLTFPRFFEDFRRYLEAAGKWTTRLAAPVLTREVAAP